MRLEKRIEELERENRELQQKNNELEDDNDWYNNEFEKYRSCDCCSKYTYEETRKYKLNNFRFFKRFNFCNDCVKFHRKDINKIIKRDGLDGIQWDIKKMNDSSLIIQRFFEMVLRTKKQRKYKEMIKKYRK